MLDEKLTLEGLFSIVLLARASQDGYRFITQGQGLSTAKSPLGLFESVEIDNDLRLVDDAIRNYYELPARKTGAQESAKQAKKAKKEAA